MTKQCIVLDYFNTSIGNVAILGFYDTTIPSVGMTIKNDDASEWRITGVGLNKLYSLDNSKYDLTGLISVFDCKVEPIGHEGELKVKSKLVFD